MEPVFRESPNKAMDIGSTDCECRGGFIYRGLNHSHSRSFYELNFTIPWGMRFLQPVIHLCQPHLYMVRPTFTKEALAIESWWYRPKYYVSRAGNAAT